MENKTYKGYEILKMLDEGKIKDGTELIFKSTIANEEIIVKVDAVTKSFINTEYKKSLSSGWLVNSTIQFKEKSCGIEELDVSAEATYDSDVRTIAIENRFKINELIQAVKQLDKKINTKGL